MEQDTRKADWSGKEQHIQIYADGRKTEFMYEISGAIATIGSFEITEPWYNVEDHWTHIRATSSDYQAVMRACNALVDLGAKFKRDRAGLPYAVFSEGDLGL